MSIKENIKKIIFICLWLIIGSGLVVLLVAAMNSRENQVCKGFDIQIKGAEKNWFVDKRDIANVLTANNTIKVKNKPTKSFDLNIVESRIKKEVWIKDAELFFDNEGILKVIVEEREPIARIFTSSGTSFYIDSTGMRLPLSEKMSAKVPVFTGFPAEGKKKNSAANKKLTKQIKDLSLFLLNDPFWMAQIAQIDITPLREFEMVPTVGNHLIEFGDGKNCETKFRRLFIFYQQVLAKTGMDKYERLKVQYDKQVIAINKTTANN